MERILPRPGQAVVKGRKGSATGKLRSLVNELLQATQAGAYGYGLLSEHQRELLMEIQDTQKKQPEAQPKTLGILQKIEAARSAAW